MSGKKKEKMQRGMAVLSVTMVLLVVITIITFFSARIIVTDNKIYQNQENAADAFNAAQAGVDYALGYLNMNLYAVQTTGLNNCSSATNTRCLASGTLQACGASPSADPTTTLANNATYTMRYSCITAGSTTYLTVSSFGKSPDQSANKTVTVTVSKYVTGNDLWAPSMANGLSSVIAAGTNGSGTAATVLAQGSSTITNSCTTISGGCPTAALTGVVVGKNITAANVAIQNTARITAAAVLTNATAPGSYGTTLQFNQSTLSSLSTTDIQNTYLGYLICGTGATCATCPAGSTCLSNRADQTSAPGVSTTYNSASAFSGASGQIIYVNVGSANTATFTGAFKLGTSAVGSCNLNPSILLVNGNASFSGSAANAATICGSVYATGTILLTNAANIFGMAMGLRGVAVNTGAGAGITGVVVGGPSTNDASVSDTTPNGVESKSGGFILFDNKPNLNARRYQEYGIVSGSWRDF